eukprot:NODE_14791_length_1085_cov_20.363257.p1 GENE.NODE_14791_length_1085_cov_20.363257~~NODE_14791_length_1085_cov_20.363257.p1  ORF type:complete len:228 (+),score=71.90 NODE_14791_length_1085_cov_20.363257:111-794(+)
MAAIKLTYFDIEGAAEKIRLALVLTRTPFEDIRLKRDEWTAMKPTTPYGQLPVMEHNGRVFAQSRAMLQLAASFGDGSLYPADVQLACNVEEALGLSDDLYKAWWPSLYMGQRPAYLGHPADMEAEAKGAKVQEMRERFVAETLPVHISNMEKLLVARNEPFFAAPFPTIADLTILPQLRAFRKGHIDFVPVTCLDQFKIISAWIDRMMAIPAIKEWYETQAARAAS